MFIQSKFTGAALFLTVLGNMINALPALAASNYQEVFPEKGSFVSVGDGGTATAFIPGDSGPDLKVYNRLLDFISKSPQLTSDGNKMLMWSADYELLSIYECAQTLSLTDGTSKERPGICVEAAAQVLRGSGHGALPGKYIDGQIYTNYTIAEGDVITLTLNPADSKALFRSGIKSVFTEKFQMDCSQPEKGCTLNYQRATLNYTGSDRGGKELTCIYCEKTPSFNGH